MTEQPLIRIRDLYKIFGRTPKEALKHVQAGLSKDDLLEQHGHVLGLSDINLDIAPRKLQVVMGLSGSGKSTLIRHINRLIEPTAGSIEIEGEDVLRMNRSKLQKLRRFKMSMVFQKFGLLPHRTVIQNVRYGLGTQGMKEAEAKQRAGEWIERVGLAGYEDHFPAQLSGGMQQRVGLARALATNAEILLMDEAFSALDPLIKKEMQEILLGLQSELSKTIVFITHDLDEALFLGDAIAILKDGAIVQSGDPQEIIMNPADGYVSDFIRGINRARSVRMRSIMEPSRQVAGAPVFGVELLEAGLIKLSASPDRSCPVVDQSTGQQIGVVTLDAALAALTASPEASA